MKIGQRPSAAKSPRLIDVFLGNDEVELAIFRIKSLSSVVDGTIVGEARSTFSGKPKPLHFADAIDSGLLPAGVQAIEIEIPREVLNAGSRWEIEQFCREFLLKKAATLFGSSVLVFTDLDEIPSVEQCRALRTAVPRRQMVSLPMRTYIRHIDLIELPRFRLMSKPKAIWSNRVTERSRYRLAWPIIAKPGYHFSSLGLDAAGIKQKHSNFAHAELDRAMFSDEVIISISNRYRINHTGRFWRIGNGLLGRVQQNRWSGIQETLADEFPDSRYNEADQPTVFQRLKWSFFITELVHGAVDAERTEVESLGLDPEGPAPVSTRRFLLALVLQLSGIPFVVRVLRRILFGDKREKSKGLLGS